MDWVKHGLVVLILGLMVVHLGLRIRLLTDHRVDLGAQEINVVYGIQKIMLGRPLYQDPELPPFDVMQYTPAYYVVCAAIGIAVGVDEHDTYALFLLSRILSLALNLAASGLVYLLCRRVGTAAWSGLAASALVFALHSEQFYSRIDSLYAVLFAAAVLVFVRSIQDGGRREWIVCALLCALAFLTKQNGVLMIGVVGAYRALARSWRPLGWFVLTAVLFIFVGLGIILIGTAPIDLWKNTVQGLMNGVVERPFHHFRDPGVYKFYAGWHIAALALIGVFFRSVNAVFRFLAVAMGVSLVFGVAASFKQGSGAHYFFEFHLLVMVACAAWLGSASGQVPRAMGGLFLAYGLLFMAHRTRQLQALVGGVIERSASLSAYRSDIRVFDVLVRELGLLPHDHVFVTYRGHLELLLNGQGLLAQKDIIEWSRTPPFDLSVFEHAMGDGTVRYVISDSAPSPIRFMGQSYSQFKPVREIDGRIIWSMRPADPGSAASH